MTLKAHDLHYRYEAGREVLAGVSLALKPGECAALVGPNGSGKSTLLRLLAGLHAPAQGTVQLDERPLSGYAARERARLVTLVGGLPRDLTFRVAELVALGRAPHLSLLGRLHEADRRAIARAMTRLGLDALTERRADSLSQGEAQRVALALALAQESPYLLLDEPMAHLDLRHSLDFLALLKSLAEDDGRAILTVSHDLNLAVAAFRRLLVLHEGRIRADGPPEDVLTPALLWEVFGVRGEVRREEGDLRLALKLW